MPKKSTSITPAPPDQTVSTADNAEIVGSVAEAGCCLIEMIGCFLPVLLGLFAIGIVCVHRFWF